MSLLDFEKDILQLRSSDLDDFFLFGSISICSVWLVCPSLKYLEYIILYIKLKVLMLYVIVLIF
jgi:hypothetical protein